MIDKAEIEEIKEQIRSGRPILQVVDYDGRHVVGFDPLVMDETLSDPRHAGILLSDILDHVVGAYAHMLGDEPASMRDYIMGVMLRENVLKTEDPTRGGIVGGLDMVRN